MEKKIRKDIICFLCFKSEGLGLLYYQKIYYQSRKKGFTRPTLVCDKCKAEFLKQNRMIEEGRPIFWNWLQIAKADMRLWMWLASDKGKEQNDMSDPLWRKKLLRLKKIAEGRRISWTNKMPMSI